jgi:superfamily I DNA and RNA helicase
VERILVERDMRRDQPVNTDDFGTALDRLESRSRFVVVDDETELAAVLEASLVQWRVFLHPSQRRLVEGIKSSPVRVLGGAGTGKTVVAMHRAKWLAENGLPEGGKVLFTTFPRNLAVEIQANLKGLCPSATLERIEVVNLDAWVRRFLQGRDKVPLGIASKRTPSLPSIWVHQFFYLNVELHW